ncbi:hypothetical protein EIN_201850 [Entamoeba invadens IP1]|uniref:Right handed beta helix domain-containing protein n=1 Tax=Entamoeba invadens IP1 TaxID=370355 RepID=A0A0A1UBN3_ENTIV|nr:hypothetical protein EIN_201850 [Entamoeba invadens IP1]ELP89640.1 hypothetical protein EIN_201850 [Entamoeba invadens IP1]|eukprot:XP_004256411.1 hypothetical protein EIN_201850 [Entamoeba invadens IP1]
MFKWFFILFAITSSKYIRISLTGNITTLKYASSLALPGDIIEFESGNYPPQHVAKRTYGAFDNPIKIRPALNAKVVFETATSQTYAFNIPDSSNIDVEGPFIARSATQQTVAAVNCTNITMSGFSIYNSTRWAMFASGTNITIRNNYADGCVLENEHCKSEKFVQCFGTGVVTYDGPILSKLITFENNEITHAWGEGIDFIFCTECVARNNYIHDVFPSMITVDNAKNLLIENNILRFSNGPLCPEQNQYHAIAIGDEDWPPVYVSTTNITVRNNFIWGARFGVSYWGWSPVAYYSEITVAQNTFFNISGLALAFQAKCVVEGAAKNNQFKNNFIYSNYNLYAALVHQNELNSWNISDNVYYEGCKNFLKDSWNGTDGNAHSIHLTQNETSVLKLWNGGKYGNCTNESYFKWDVPTYCFVPHNKSLLYHSGVYVTYYDLDAKMNKDFYGCVRSNIKPSIGVAEGQFDCVLVEGSYTCYVYVLLSAIFLII